MTHDCPICGTTHPASIDCRAKTPVLMNRLYPSREAARAASQGTLAIVACNDCGFAWNRAFEPRLVVYDSDYENDQMHSAAFVAHVEARAAEMVRYVPVGTPIDYLEIGCGQGGFIGTVARAAAGQLRSAEGFDPAWRGKDADGPDGSRIHRAYFGTESRRRLTHAPNIVASRHTIEHVPDTVAFLTDIRTSLGPQSRARLFIETPCINWILANEAMQDLFYEHCSIFSAASLHFALERAGFEEVTVDNVFGGQYLWAIGTAGITIEAQPPRSRGVGAHGDVAVRFAAKWRTAVSSARDDGPVALWGAGAKGVTFTLLADPESRLIDHAIDINPGKQGLYLAGSGLEVLSPRRAAARKAKTIFVMNPNYLNEIEHLASAAGISAALIAIN